MLLVGEPGTGKTHLATALAAEACGRGKRVRFCRVTELVTQLLEAREERHAGAAEGRSWRGWTCWSWTSWGTCRRARSGRSCCST